MKTDDNKVVGLFSLSRLQTYVVKLPAPAVYFLRSNFSREKTIMKNKSQLKNYVLGFIQIILVLFVLAGVGQAATYVVTNINDSGAGSLRQAILNANANAGADTINFNIVGNGVQIIGLQTELPKITDALTINGTTQPGYTTNPQISITKAIQNNIYDYGLSIEYGTATIKALNIYGFTTGIEVVCASNCAANRPGLILTGSRIGTNFSGTAAFGNGTGIFIDGADGGSTQIGGTGANESNVISGNWVTGIELTNATCVGCSINNDPTRSHKIIGNKIGTNTAGTADLGNGEVGIIVGTNKVTIGGDTAVERNIISGNDETGIYVYADNTVIEGNYIGTNATGDAAIANTYDGIYLQGTNNVRIGGTTAGTGNTISGNGESGIQVAPNIVHTCALGCSTDVYKATNTLIYGNRIGTNAAGTAAVPNMEHGIRINADDTIVGQSETGGAANIIAGNAENGVHILEGVYPLFPSGSVAVPSANNRVQRNYIGTNGSGAILGNSGSGIFIINKANNTMVGGNDSAQKNIISNNSGPGVILYTTPGQTAPLETQITLNDISANGGKGIAIYNNDSEGTDPLDADTGANDLQNHPILSGAFPSFITGTFHSRASKFYTLHFYSSPTCDASGRGEGKNYLGSQDISTDINGNASFTTSFGAPAGTVVTVTATTSPRAGVPTGTTSEFSNCVTTLSANPGNFGLSSATYTANENANAITVTVNRTGGTLGGVKVNYATADVTATAGQDYADTHGTLTFAAGEMSKQFTIPILEDIYDEQNETVNIALSNPSVGAGLSSPSSAVLTINDNDATPTLSIGDVSQAEGNQNTTNFNFVVTLAGASAQNVTVNYQTAGNTATSGVDYASASGTLTFAPGNTSKTITVQVFGELTVELDEIFKVNLSAPVNATMTDAEGVGTILDDDNPGKLSFALAPYNVNENAGVATVTVTRTNGDAGTVSVDYATTNSGTATAFSDYTPVANTLIFLDGEVTKTFTVPIVEDQIVENTESVGLILSNPTGGAGLGLAGAVINITDNDNGNSLAISGHIKKQDNSPLANVQVALQGTQNLTTTTDANGDYSFTGLTPNGNYTVTPSILGYIFTPINYEHLNLTTSVTNANFTATATPSRMVRVVGGDTVAGQAVSAIVEIVAQGDENSVGFSLSYDAMLLSNPQVVLASDSSSASLVVNNTQTAQGRLGVLLSLPAGQVFAAGTKQLVEVTFNTAQTQAYSTPLNFNNLPLGREVANLNADPLPTDWTSGTITFAQGYESDVSPRPMGTGNGSVTVADFTQIGRFVAGLNAPDQMNEYQRADTAPRISKGNGALTVSDYTQAGRYAAGLDPIQFAGGPTQASRIANVNRNADKDAKVEATNRAIRVVNASAFPGQQVLVAIELDAQGDENSFGFSLNYDPTKLSNPSVSLGADTQGTTLITNTLQAGKIGVLIGLTPGTSIQTGVRQIVVVRFTVLNVPSGQTPITFNDNPIGREVVDANVNVLETNYANGIVTIMGTTAAQVSVGGQITDANGYGVSKATVTITSMSGQTQTVLTNPFGYYQFSDIEVGEMYILSVSAKRYRFNPSTKMLSVVEESNQINFVADN